MADIGALLSGISGSLAQGRDYNLAVARARASAGLRLRQIELDERESELSRLRVQQATEESRIKTLAEREDLKAQLRQSRRETEAEKTIAEYEEAVSEPILSTVREIGAGRAVPGGPERRVRRLGRKAASAYETLDREVPARLEEQLQTPFARREREAKLESEQALGAQRRRAARPVGGPQTQKERDRAKWLSLDTSEDERALIERDLFGGKTTVDGVSLSDIRSTLNTLYPESFGIREGVPEGIDPNSVEFLRHGAQLIKQAQGNIGLVPDLDADITVDSLFVR